MKAPLFAVALAAIAMPLAATPAAAQPNQRELREDVRDARENLRDARQDRREARRNWRNYSRYDYNRYEPGTRAYYADDYYRDGSYYRERRLSRGDRIYVGRDGRHYCRRSDGTTGLIVGAAIGGLIGNSLDRGRSSLLGTLIGAGAGAAIGSEIQRGNVRCR